MREFLAWSLLVLMASCSGSDPGPPLETLSEECDECLRQEDSDGCGDAYQACSVDEACNDLILCELGQRCYHEPGDGECAAKRGCVEPSDEEAANDADAFEACARDVCRSACGFREE
jgi:hypothetical protein